MEQERNISLSGPPPVSTDQPGTLYLASVGVGQYPQDSLRLRFPAKDARDFAAAMQGQQGRLFRNVEARVLCDDEARRRNVLEAVDWLRRKAGESDMAVLFLAGHGCTHVETGNYYFLPWDVEPESLIGTAVAGYELREQISHIKGKRLLFMDTCRAGNVFADGQMMRLRGNFGTDVSSFIRDLQRTSSATVIFASSTGAQPSAESDRWGNGAFTRALVEGLTGQARTPACEAVTVNLLAGYVGRRVPELTRGLQTPTTAILQTMTDFPLAVGPFVSAQEPGDAPQGGGPPASRSGSRLAPPPDADYDADFYVHRVREEKAMLNRLRRPGSAVVLQGPWLFGKATLLSHTLAQAGPGAVAIRLSLARFDGNDLATFDSLLQRLGRSLLEQVLPAQADELLQAAWSRPGSEKNRLTWLVERHVLPQAERLYLAIELADRVHGHPYQHDFFALLRGWVESRGEVWARLRLMVTVSTEPTRLESTDHSSFFVKANPIQLGELSRVQVGQLAELHGYQPADPALDGLMALVGGHPYLIRLALYEASTQEVPLGELDPEAGMFGSHLHRLRRFVEERRLLQAVAAVLSGQGLVLPEDHYALLYSQGVLLEEKTGAYRLRCKLYEEFFTRLCGSRR